MKCGLLGQKLEHSYSPAIHQLLGNYEYTLFEKEPEELENFLQNGGFDGINVTMPYKKAVIPFLNSLTPIAEKLGAVNTIIRQEGKLIGFNTDYWGFHSMLENSGLSPKGKKCLVLGSGGASKVVQCVLRDLEGQVIVISRSGENHYGNLSRHTDAAIIINTTPVGMYPDTCISPIDLALFPRLEGVLDVIYNPARTQLLMDAERLGIITMNGLWMLVSQAIYASACFTGLHADRNATEKIYKTLKTKMENIVLIGMPGCGKSTVGKLLAEYAGKRFVDTDEEIVKLAQKSIPRIFAEDGEAVFRAYETQVLKTFGKQSGLVIATGGGCVTKAENYPLLHQNGRIFWLQRDICNLSTEGRPLSQGIALSTMYHTRKDLYATFADGIIENNGTPEKAATAILEKMK
jgi:shikimate dehydrogenase